VVSLDDSSSLSDDGIRNIQAWELGKILKFKKNNNIILNRKESA